ncbi:MAG: SEL1-like repeat protein [Proteobacteria bacterium]|nr:SEL1-like repeat protein [Pseudomonadota bacterium]
MGEASAQEPQPEAAPAERDQLRDSVLAAARSVAERDGIEAVTVGKVAGEAGLSRAQVMRFFPRKEDILMSIASDDLATLQRNMDEAGWPEGGDTPETATPVAATLAEAAPEPADQPAAARPRLVRKGDLANILDLKSSAEGGDAKEGAPRAPDAWLERRLRTFERSMAAIESRQADVEKNARAAAAAVEENIKTMQATVDALQERAEAAEAKAKAAANELRMALNEATLRIQTVEGVAHAALAEAHPSPAADAVQPSLAESVAEPVLEPSVPEPAPEAIAEAPQDDAPKSFIAEARKSMVAAGAAAAAEEAAKAAVDARKGRRGTTRYLLAGIGILIVFIAAAGIAFSKGIDDGRRDALAHITRIVKPVANLAVTPLDRLTAKAQTGDANAELAVALRYRDRKDPADAFHWMSLAAVHGQAIGQYLLGSMYARGDGTATDAAHALQWYEASALQGNRKAMHALAIAYAEGEGTTRNPEEAARWFSRAASFGLLDSQFNLAVLYERGMGVPQSLLDAYKWYAVAARQGDSEAIARMDALKTQLGADDLAAAQRAAGSFKPVAFNIAANEMP